MPEPAKAKVLSYPSTPPPHPPLSLSFLQYTMAEHLRHGKGVNNEHMNKEENREGCTGKVSNFFLKSES
jgi:hypothetical protein